jgi:hypothetical protein
MPMTPLALKNGLYLRPLSKRESATTALLGPLFQHWQTAAQPERVIALANLVLEFFPNEVSAMLSKGYAYGRIFRRDYVSKYPYRSDVPATELARYEDISRKNHLWYEKAEALGWREPSAQEETRYVEMVRGLKKP